MNLTDLRAIVETSDADWHAFPKDFTLDLLDLVEASEGLGLETVCILDDPCHGCRACRFGHRLNVVMDAIGKFRRD